VYVDTGTITIKFRDNERTILRWNTTGTGDREEQDGRARRGGEKEERRDRRGRLNEARMPEPEDERMNGRSSLGRSLLPVLLISKGVH